MLFDDKVWVAFVLFIWEGLMQIVTSIVIHNLHQFLSFNLVHGFPVFVFGVFADGQRVELSGLLEDHVVFVELADDVYDAKNTD